MGLPRIKGTSDDDILNGTAVAEEILGQAGNDQIFGLDGNDRLRGGDGDDEMFGGNGNDRLRGDHGDDTLTGGAGRDRFIFNLQGGTDTIEDYNDAEDRLDFSNFNITANATQSAFEVLMSHAEQVGGKTVFTMDGGETIILENTSIAVLDVSDFIM